MHGRIVWTGFTRKFRVSDANLSFSKCAIMCNNYVSFLYRSRYTSCQVTSGRLLAAEYRQCGYVRTFEVLAAVCQRLHSCRIGCGVTGSCDPTFRRNVLPLIIKCHRIRWPTGSAQCRRTNDILKYRSEKDSVDMICYEVRQFAVCRLACFFTTYF
jgi:hypothetical protein